MKRLLNILTLNLLLAIAIVIVSLGFMENPRLERMLWPFVVSFTYSTFIGGLCWWALPRLAPRFKKSPWVRWPQLTLLLTVLSLTGGTVAFLILKYQPFVNLRMDYRQSMVTCWIITMGIGVISYVVEEAKHRIQATTLQLRTRELEREKALKAAADAKLQSLESRIHPHFLFNTLNSISSLVRSDPSKAEALIERLAALLRFSLDRHGSLVPLQDEIRITDDYLDIEKTRFGDRLRYRFEISEELNQTMLPAMSIQTLAENSVKYAVGAQRSGAELVIRAYRSDKSVYFVVSDTGPGFDPDSLPVGHGLDTLKQRLESFFGDQTELTTKRLEKGMEVSFRVPC